MIVLAFASFFVLVAAWLAAPRDAAAETVTAPTSLPVAEAKA